MARATLKSKFLGSLIGTGLGDALGAGLEGWHLVDEAEVWLLAGKRDTLTYTDDTHMMIGVAESLIAKKGFDGEHMARTFMDNYAREPYRGYGPGPPRVFRLIQGGESWDQAAAKLYGGGSFGNGAAMRIAPVGVLYYDDPTQMKATALRSSQITHAHELGKEGAVLQACAVALAVAADPAAELRTDEFLMSLSTVVQQQAFQEKLGKLGELLGKPDRVQVVEQLGHGVEALDSVPAAVYSFLSHPNSFEKAVTYAISLGGDTDTIGAMTGAITGAYLGIEAIPREWQERLENREYIMELAEELWRIKIDSESGS
jgi:poly(ADP-ribose) glycohydrolase ARH3